MISTSCGVHTKLSQATTSHTLAAPADSGICHLPSIHSGMDWSPAWRATCRYFWNHCNDLTSSTTSLHEWQFHKGSNGECLSKANTYPSAHSLRPPVSLSPSLDFIASLLLNWAWTPERAQSSFLGCSGTMLFNRTLNMYESETPKNDSRILGDPMRTCADYTPSCPSLGPLGKAVLDWELLYSTGKDNRWLWFVTRDLWLYEAFLWLIRNWEGTESSGRQHLTKVRNEHLKPSTHPQTTWTNRQALGLNPYIQVGKAGRQAVRTGGQPLTSVPEGTSTGGTTTYL